MKRKQYTRFVALLVVLLICIQLCACGQSSSSPSSSANANSGKNAATSAPETEQPDDASSSNGEWVGIWLGASGSSVMYFNADGTICSADLLAGKPDVANLERVEYEVSNNQLSFTASDGTYISYAISISDNIMALESEEWGDIYLRKLTDIQAPPTLVGSWEVCSSEEFTFRSGYRMIGDSISFYNDGTFWIDEESFGEYSIIFDGQSLCLDSGVENFGEYGPYTMWFAADDLLVIETEDATYCFLRTS